MSFLPYIIRHSIIAGKNFEAEPPPEGPKLDGIVHLYADRPQGGLIKFSPRATFNLKRLVLHVADADTWSLSLLHTGADIDENPELVLADSAGTLIENASKSESSDGQTVSLFFSNFGLVPGDALLVRTAGASEKLYVEAFALPNS